MRALGGIAVAICQIEGRQPLHGLGRRVEVGKRRRPQLIGMLPGSGSPRVRLAHSPRRLGTVLPRQLPRADQSDAALATARGDYREILIEGTQRVQGLAASSSGQSLLGDPVQGVAKAALKTVLARERLAQGGVSAGKRPSGLLQRRLQLRFELGSAHLTTP